MTRDAREGGPEGRDLYVFNAGFLRDARLKRILALAGWDVRLGWPGAAGHIGVWGHSPTAHRGERVAARTGAALVRVEDAFLRSVHTGRDGDRPLGLLIDESGAHFDPRQPSDLEVLLATHPLDDTALLNRARELAAQLQRDEISKYSAFDPALAVPDPGYVLVVDQTRGDAAVTASGATRATFAEMLVFAQEEHPGAKIVILSHPETMAGHRPGYYSQADANQRISLLSTPVSPWQMLAGAVGVYTVSSQLGFEAILAGHRPRVFGQPFYAGWGLSADENAPPRRTRTLTAAQLAAAALLLYPTWYDPHFDRLCKAEDVARMLAARARAWRADRRGYVASGMRLWKRGHLKQAFGGRIAFEDRPDAAAAKAQSLGRPLLVWAGKEDAAHRAAPALLRVEDGFLRSRGLGAELVPPLSLVADDLGIYYDPTRSSRLEALIAASVNLPEAEIRRAERLIAAITRRKLSKYNLDAEPVDLPEGRRILVAGQVEDDASVLLGAGEVTTNLGLLKAARQANPDAIIAYKPHPDVEAGLRIGALDARNIADVVAAKADPLHLLALIDEVWTISSTLGFEALLRRKPVTCLGLPFYAGWGLTHDLTDAPDRRRARPTLAGFAHAVLIGYPRYHDPVTRRPCPPEVIVERLSGGNLPRPGPGNRALSKLQGLFASAQPFWR